MPKSSGRPGAAKDPVITVRIPPRLKFALELMARKNHSTTSSIVLKAIEEATKSPSSGLFFRTFSEELGDREVSILKDAWDISEAERTIKLARIAPDLLSQEEQAAWKVVKESLRYWKESEKIEPNYTVIRDSWDQINIEARKFLDT